MFINYDMERLSLYKMTILALWQLGLDSARFHFYLHKQASIDALAGWAEAGFSLDAVDDGIRDWATLHKLLGIDFNVQIVNDHAPP